MRASIKDRNDLLAISPEALSLYARAGGWMPSESYGDFSDVYVAEGLPEIIVPRTQELGDYALVVSQLIGIFARVAETDEHSLYSDLMTTNRDVIRVRATESVDDGTVGVSAGLGLVHGSRKMLLAAACSLWKAQEVYRRPNKAAAEFLRRVRLGQTEQGSFIVTLLIPAISAPVKQTGGSKSSSGNDPFERRVTRRLVSSLKAVRRATERSINGDDYAFMETVERGVSANLCDALAKLTDPFPTVEITLTWARVSPVGKSSDTFRFINEEVPILQTAAQLFRESKLRRNVRMRGVVKSLRRDQRGAGGKILLLTSVDGKDHSVTIVLRESQYEEAIRAHSARASVVVQGDLQKIRDRWHLHNPHLQRASQASI